MFVSTIHAPYGAIHSECSINPYGLFDTRFVDAHDMFDYENQKDRGKGSTGIRMFFTASPCGE